MDTNEIKATAANPAGNAGNPAEEARAQGAGTDVQMPVEPSKLDNLRNMVSSRHDNAKYENDDDFYAAIADDYAAHDKEKKHYQENEDKIKGLFTRDPRSAAFMKSWIDGGDPVVALIKHYGEDFKSALEDPEMADKIAAANKEFVDQMAKEKGLEDEYLSNIDKSLDVIDKLQQEKGYTDEKIDAALVYLRKSAHDIIMGKYSQEMVEAAMKAQNYDADMANAAHEAEVRGKNSRIEEQLRKPKKGDGMPQMGSRNTTGAASERPSIPGALGREKKSIWDAGGGIKRGR